MFTPPFAPILALVPGAAGAVAAERPVVLDLTRSRVEVVVKFGLLNVDPLTHVRFYLQGTLES